MTSQVGGADLRVAQALSYVCGHRDDLAALLDEDDDALRDLEAVIGRPAVDGVSLTALLNILHIAVRRAGDPSGVYGGTNRNVTLAGVGDLNIVYRCPLQLCIGRAGHEMTGDTPRCQFDPTRAPLIRERLP